MLTKLKASAGVILLSSCFVFSLLFLLLQGGKLGFMLFTATAFFCIYLAVGKYSGIHAVKGTRDISTNASSNHPNENPGRTVSVKLQFQVPGFLPISFITIRDSLYRRGSAIQIFETSLPLDWHRRGEFIYQIPALKRGYYDFLPIECKTSDVLGLFEHQGIIPSSDSIRIPPQTVFIPHWKGLNSWRKGRFSHAFTTKRLRETNQINGVRDYHPGDSISRIHWNASFKTGELKSKEFEREIMPKLIVMLDRDRKSYLDAELFELAISITASVLSFSRLHHLVSGLVSAGEIFQYFEPKADIAAHELIMEHLIDALADGHCSLREVFAQLSHRIPQNSLFVVVSPRPVKELMDLFRVCKLHDVSICYFQIVGSNMELLEESNMNIESAMLDCHYPIQNLQELPTLLAR